MSTHDGHDEGDNGGMPARRAVVRWAGRLARREWRQHTLIVVLITVAVASTVLIATVAYNAAPAEGRADFGDAEHALVLDDVDPSALAGTLEAAADAFGHVDPIGHRTVALPGTLENVDYRSQDIDGPYGSPLLDVVEGRAPVADAEAAITDRVATMLGIAIGDSIDLDGTTRQVIGIVENPSDLDDEFVLLPPSAMVDSDSVRVLVRGDQDAFRRYDPPNDGPRMVNSRSDVPEDVLAAVLMLLASTILMFLVALVAAASFTVIAQRRLPQFGMLSAIGATERHVRLTMLASGAIAGVLSAVTGAAIGLTSWWIAAPAMESIVDYRIDRGNVPWWVVLAGMLLAVVTATGAAWWPARTMSRIPPVLALSGRVPRPAPTRRSALTAVVLLAAGIVSLRVGTGFDDQGPSTFQLVLMAAGTLLVIAGVLLVSPVLVRSLGRLARMAPISGRLALRDLSRYQSRSGAALAAIGLALGIPSVVVASTAAAENQTGLGNLSPTQIVVRPDEFEGAMELPDSAALAETEQGVAELVDAVGAQTALPLEIVRDPDAPSEPGIDATPPLGVVQRVDRGWRHIANVYLATPGLLAAFGLEADALAGSDDVVTVADGDAGELQLFGTPGSTVERIGQGRPLSNTGTLPETYTSLPGALVDPGVVAERGWEAVDGGYWLIETAESPTPAQLEDARDIAARFGFVIEARDGDSDLSMVRLAAGLAGMALALGVLAMTVGLMRSESANDVRTLTATGATRAIRRGVTAVTAGSLATLGAGLGIAAAYIGLIAGGLDDLMPLPWLDLVLIGAGTPVVASVAAWMLSGREPVSVARRALD
jgi:putative ABC transport system permease protein